MVTTEASGTLHLPSTWKRFSALMIDGIIFSLPTLIGFALGLFRMTGGELILPWVPYFFSAVVTISFHFFCLIHWSRTPGKMLFGLYITDAQTLKTGLSAKQAALRMLGGFLCVPFSLAPLAYAFFRTDRRQLSDLIAGTQVMQEAPRKNPPKIRWIIGGLLVVYFFITGTMTFLSTIKMLKFSAEGISISLAAPEAAPAAKSVKPAPEAAKTPAPALAPVQAAAPASAKAEAAAPSATFATPDPKLMTHQPSPPIVAVSEPKPLAKLALDNDVAAKPSATRSKIHRTADLRYCLDLLSYEAIAKCAGEE